MNWVSFMYVPKYSSLRCRKRFDSNSSRPKALMMRCPVKASVSVEERSAIRCCERTVAAEISRWNRETATEIIGATTSSEHVNNQSNFIMTMKEERNVTLLVNS